MKIPIPKSFHDETKPYHYCKSMCRTCAYHVEPTEEEIEMEISMRMLRPERHHACHERKNVWCAGSVEFQKRFEDVSA